MIEKLIDVFMHLDRHISNRDEYGICFTSDFVKAVEDVLVMLKNQDANGVTVQKWIPVTERLPDKQHDWVLATGILVPEDFYGVPHIAELRNGEWWDDSGDFPLIDLGVEVTHWMPLPEPPKEKDHE